MNAGAGTGAAATERHAAPVAAGSALAVIGGAAGVGALAAIGGVPIALGLLVAAPFYAIGHFATKRVQSRQRATAAPAPPADDDAEILASLDELEVAIVGKVPALVQARVERVASLVRETIPRLAEWRGDPASAHAVLRTATSYLPEAVAAYTRLPRDFADRRPVSGSKTSLAILCDQLDLLASKMADVLDAVCRADADALIAHGRFLNQKFSTGALALDPQNRIA